MSEDEMLEFVANVREDILHPGVTCAHCGFQQRGSAEAEGKPLCHPNISVYPDCYRLVTVYGETIGTRRPCAHDTPGQAGD